MKPSGTLLLKRNDVAALLSIEECIAAVEQAFKLYGEGRTEPPGILGVHAREGGFHIKAGLMDLNRTYFAAKTNANFPENTKRFNLPTIQGVVLLCDGENGYPLALMDSMELTITRTGAATAVATKYLARPDAKIATICGCGNQGRISLQAIMKVRSLERAYAYDIDETQARKFADELSQELLIEVQSVSDLADAVRQSDICATCTPSKKYFLETGHISPGTFIAAVGADNEEKQELDPKLLAQHKVVVDVLAQAATIGDLHHAIELGLLKEREVHAELGEVIAGKKSGRTSQDEIIIFDSTGMALQDVVASVAIYEKAVKMGGGFKLNFAE